MSDIASTEFLRLIKVCFDLSASVLRHYLSTQLILPQYGSSFIRFLDYNKHMFYHLWESANPCCECSSDFKQGPQEMQNWMFYQLFFFQKETRCGKPQTTTDMLIRTMQRRCICRVISVQTLTLEDLDISILTFLLKHCCPMSRVYVKSINSLRQKLCHASNTACLTPQECDQMWQILENAIVSLAEQIDKAFYNIIKEHLKIIKQADVDRDEIMQLLTKNINQLQVETSNSYAKTEEIHCLVTECADKLENVVASAIDLKNGQNAIKQEVTKTADESREVNQAILKELGDIKDLIINIGEYKKIQNCFCTEVTFNSAGKIDTDEKQGRTDIKVVVNCDGVNEDAAISRLIDEKNDKKPNTLQLSNAKKMCILLDMIAGPEIFQSEETFKGAIDELIDRIIIAGEIDTTQHKTMKITFTIKSPLNDEQCKVVYGTLSKYGKLNISDKTNDKESKTTLEQTLFRPEFTGASYLLDKLLGKKKDNQVFTIEDEIRIAILGKTGAGKSETGNTILGSDQFQSDFSASSITKHCGRKEAIRGDKKVILIDTPGLCDTDENITQEDTKKEIAKCVAIASPGVHCFLIVLEIGRFTEEEYQAIQHLINLFGENAQKYSIVLFTKIDKIPGDDDPIEEKLKKYLETVPPVLDKFLSDCDKRYVGFNNRGKQKQKKQQVKILFDLIKVMVDRNGGACYTSTMFEEAEKKIQEIIENEKNEKCKAEREHEEKLRTKLEEEQKRENIKKLEKEYEVFKENMRLREQRMNEEIRDMVRNKIQNEDPSLWSKITGGLYNFMTLNWF